MNRFLPAVLMAAGFLAATAVSLASGRSFAWAMAGPLMLAATLFAVNALRHRELPPKHWYGDAILGAAIVAAGAIVALADPAFVPSLMPILGTCAAFTLVPGRRASCSLG